MGSSRQVALDEYAGWIDEYQRVTEAIERLEESKAEIRNRIIDAMGGDGVGTLRDEPVLTLTTTKRRSVSLGDLTKAVPDLPGLGDLLISIVKTTESPRLTLQSRVPMPGGQVE